MRTPSRSTSLSVALILAAICAASTAFAGIHELKLSPPGTGADDGSCLQQTTEISREFSRQTGASIVEAACESDDVYRNVAVIRYAAPEPIHTYDSNESFTTYFAPTYESAEACAAGLAAELPIFRRHTTLEPFAAYCYSIGSSHFDGLLDATGITGTEGFSTAIYAVNTARSLPVSRKRNDGAVLGLPPLEPETMKATIWSIGQRAGVDVVAISVGRSLASWEIYASYYGSKRLNLLAMDLGYFGPAALGTSCESTATLLNQTWSSKGLIEAHFFCMDASSNTRRLGITWWTPSALDDGDFAVTMLSAEYPDTAACESAKQQVIENLTGAGETVHVAYCSYAVFPSSRRTNPLRVTVISKP